MIKRYSSRRIPLDASFLAESLTGAQTYDRIADYFSSSILEIDGEDSDHLAENARLLSADNNA